ncbi:MAG: type VII secretion integral membrane protein EccD [Aldersonia sp.]|nr:type VII secretion integral membrane protein EccD [Aldersonia sp.]
MTHAGTTIQENASRVSVRAPELCRLTIVAQRTQVDLALPAEVPVALLIPGIVDLISAHGRSNEFDAAGETTEPAEWVLARVGQSPLSATLSLDEHGVRDGELLMLEGAEHGAPQPLFDDIMYSVATAGADSYRGWSAGAARLAGSVTAAVATLVGCLALLWAAKGAENIVAAVVTFLITALFVTAGAVIGRLYQDTASALVLCGCALPTAATTGVLLVPAPLSWAHALLGTAFVGATAVTALRLSNAGLRLFTATMTGAVLLVPAELVGTLTSQPIQSIAAVLAGAALAVVAATPRMAMMMAKLPLPGVPSPGAEVDTDSDDQTLSFAALSVRAANARRFMTGLVAGATVVAAAAAVTAAQTGAPMDWPAIAFALVCAAVLMFRGRTFASAEQASTLIAGGVAILIALLVGAALTAGAPLAVFGAAMALTVAALALGIVAPTRTYSPPMRRAAELFEYACAAAVVPLLCWVADLYTLIRGL